MLKFALGGRRWNRLAISAALIELIVGIVAGNTIHPEVTPWVNFLASFGAVILTFLAGAELESEVIKAYWKKSLVLGFISFFAPFLGGWKDHLGSSS
jgi:Kef-type K+ transport system membrane component KefB